MSPRSRWIAITAALAAVVVVGSLTTQRAYREREWRHGGDGLGASAVVRVADAAGLPAALTAAGGKPDAAMLLEGEDQAVAVQVRWSRPASEGMYELLVLDNRVTPPKPLTPRAGWASRGDAGLGWDGRYEVLSERYRWLAATGSVQIDAGSWAFGAMAVSSSARQAGSIGGAFFDSPPGGLPVTDPARDLLVVVFHTDEDSNVRWATRVPVHG